MPTYQRSELKVDSEYTDPKMKLRQEVLNILLTKFGSGDGEYLTKSIYECADEWCSKQVSTNGLVSYYKAYYNK